MLQILQSIDICQISQPLILQQASGDIAKENLISAYFVLSANQHFFVFV